MPGVTTTQAYKENSMVQKSDMSRRQFVTSVAAVAAISSFPSRSVLAGVGAPPQAEVAPTDHPAWKDPAWKDQGIENLAKSPHAKLRNIPVRAVTIHDGFWGRRREVNVSKSIPTMHDLLEANGRMNNYRRLAGKSSESQRGPVYSDSDVYKWTEAAGFVLQSGDRPRDAVYRTDQTRGPRGSRHVCLLRRHGLLHGDRG